MNGDSLDYPADWVVRVRRHPCGPMTLLSVYVPCSGGSGFTFNVTLSWAALDDADRAEMVWNQSVSMLYRGAAKAAVRQAGGFGGPLRVRFSGPES